MSDRDQAGSAEVRYMPANDMGVSGLPEGNTAYFRNVEDGAGLSEGQKGGR